MASKDIVGLLTLHDKDGNVVHQGGNLSFLYASRKRTIYKWNANYGGAYPTINIFPWKNTYLLTDDDITLGHNLIGGNSYPFSTGFTMANLQYNWLRTAGTSASVAASAISRVFGCVMASATNFTSFTNVSFLGDTTISQVDVPLDYTQVGVVYMHPASMAFGTLTTGVGLAYVTYTNGTNFDTTCVSSLGYNIVRLETGADAGYYFVSHNDTVGNRLYLRTLDGRAFSATATATVPATLGPGRRAWFNEVSIIPLSVGTMDTGSSRYSPRQTDAQNRGSFVLRATLDKSGSTEVAVGTEQQGSYFLSTRSYTHGDGSEGSTIFDYGGLFTGNLLDGVSNTTPPPWFNFWQGGVNGMALDWPNQRLWFGYTNVSNQSGIAMWRYKTSESFREIANYLGTAAQATYVTPSIDLGAGDYIVDLEIGSQSGSAAGWVYVTIGHASGGNAGVAIIKPNLTTVQYKYTTGVLPLLPSPQLAACQVDKSRTRVGTTSDTSTDGSNNITITAATGRFTSSDIGRAIKLTGLGADSGTYLISAIGALTDAEATSVGVTTMAGGAVTFTSQTGGTYEIGDRLYLFFGVATNNNTTNAGKMTYMESMAPGTFLQRTVTMERGASTVIRLAGVSNAANGQSELCSIDPDTGNIFWASADSVIQMNKYTVATNTHEFIPMLLPGLISPPNGVPANPGTPTTINALKVSSQFDNIWWGTDVGHFRINKSAPWTPTLFAINAVNTGTKTFTVTGNAAALVATNKFVVSGSSGNNGQYTVVSATFGSPNTAIVVSETIPSATADGSVWFSSAASVTVKRYVGNETNASAYQNPAGFPRISGTTQVNANTNVVRGYYEAPDGRMWTTLRGSNAGTQDYAHYGQGSDNWHNKDGWNHSNGNEGFNLCFDPYGLAFGIFPSSAVTSVGTCILGQSEVQYQWDEVNSVWFPREVAQAGVPNKSITDTIYNPGCLTRPIHSTLQDTFKGVKFRFNRQGGATPPNNEFLGRAGMAGVTGTGGTTTAASSTFTGSGFSASDVGRLLRIEEQTTNTDGATAKNSNVFTGSGFVVGDVGRTLRINTGADLGTYKVASYSSATSITLLKLTGSVFKASATTGGTLSYVIDRGVDSGVYKVTAYNSGSGGTQVTLALLTGAAWSAVGVTPVNWTVWDLGSPGSNAGPENITVLAADGFAKDNTQDITGVTFENFGAKTRFHEFDEGRKFAVANPLAVPGSTATGFYFETYPRQTTQYDASTAHHKALPAAELTNGRVALDGLVDKAMDGTGGKGNAQNPGGNIWHGTSPSNSVSGYSSMVDFGADVEVGYIMYRTYTPSLPTGLAYTSTHNGLIGNWYKATAAGGAPVNSSTIRTSGTTNLNISGADVTTATVAALDFLGSVTTGPFSNGVMVVTQNTFAGPLATFVTGDVGKVLKISGTAGADTGSYRITAVSLDGSTATIRNLDQTAKAWTVGASGVTYEVRDAVREEDELLVIRVSGVGNGTTGLTFSVGSVVLNSSTAIFAAGDVGKLVMITGASNPANNGVFPITGFTSTTSITYTNANGVTQSNFAGTVYVYSHWLGVERLTSATALQLRTGPNATVTSQSWQVVSPNWSPVKRLSFSTEALPPDVKANGTWLSLNGADAYYTGDAKIYFDLTDLTQAQRTGRYWKWTAQPRFNTNVINTQHYIRDIEFYDTSGKRLAQSPYTSCDQVQTNPDFMFNWTNRIDWVQAANDAMSGVSGFNGNAGLAGANGDTITLTTGGNKFLGFQIGPIRSDGGLPVGTAIINSASSSFPASASLGRFIRVLTGTNAGSYYRVASRPSATQITVTTPSGAAVSWVGTETNVQFTLHEGFNAGGAAPDKFVFTSDLKELTILTVNDALTSITVSESLQPTRSNQAWEIRRPGFQTASITTEPTKTARLMWLGSGTYGVQSGDIVWDSHGYHSFFAEDIGSGIQRTDGAIAGGSGVFASRAFAINAVNTGTKTFTVTGDASSLAGRTFTVSGSTGNDGTYTAVSAVFSTPNTDIVVVETVPSAVADGTATGSRFSPDDVGRLLYVLTGVNKGIYEISVFTSATSITVKNHFTGAAVSFTADAAVTYQMFGDRRVRLSKYVTGLRS
jgi:hypothetical protein